MRNRKLTQAPSRKKQATEINEPEQINQAGKVISDLISQKTDTVRNDLESQNKRIERKVDSQGKEINEAQVSIRKLESGQESMRSIQVDVESLKSEVKEIPTQLNTAEVERKVNSLSNALSPVAEKAPEINQALNQKHQQNTDTMQGAQERDLDMGGHNIKNVKKQGDEVATKEELDDGLRRALAVTSRGQGGGTVSSDEPRVNGEYTRWHRDRLQGRSAAEVKEDLSLEDSDINALITATKLDDLTAPDDNTDLNASSSAHGLLPKLDNTGSKYLRDDGIWQTVSGTGTVDTSGTPVDNDYAKFTDADTIEGRSYAEVKQDLSLDNVENTVHSTDAHTMTIDGRDVSVDGTKLDGIEASAVALATVKADSDIADAITKKHAANGDTDLDATFEATFEKVANKGANSGYCGLDASGIVDPTDLPDASTTVEGVSESAIASEVNTGTDAVRHVTPDALAGSNFGIRYLQAVVFDFTTDCATGDGKMYWHIPPALNGMNLVYCHAEVITAGTTNTMDIQIHNLTDTADMLSTVITIDTGETGSDTAATPYVINGATDDVATNDVIRVDVDAVHTTAAKGLIITLGFQLP